MLFLVWGGSEKKNKQLLEAGKLCQKTAFWFQITYWSAVNDLIWLVHTPLKFISIVLWVAVSWCAICYLSQLGGIIKEKRKKKLLLKLQ